MKMMEKNFLYASKKKVQKKRSLFMLSLHTTLKNIKMGTIVVVFFFFLQTVVRTLIRQEVSTVGNSTSYCSENFILLLAH